MKRRTALFVTLLLALPLLAACGQQTPPETQPEPPEWSRYETSFFGTFDTIVILQGFVHEEETFTEVAQKVHEIFQQYHRVFDAYNAYEGVHNLYEVNQKAADGPTPAEPELIELLLYCKQMQPRINDEVNVALGAVLDLWHQYRDSGEGDPENAEIPPMKRLEKAAQHVDFDDVVIHEAEGTIEFLDPELKLDVGAVAKGYTAEIAAQWMLQNDMPSFLLSAGGNVRLGTKPEDGREYWGVSIQDPNGSVFTSANEDILDVLFVVDESVVTSGDYQRFYVVDGVRYHHIISPETLMPSDHYRSVTVVTEDSGWADMLSTAFFLMPIEEGEAFAKTLEGVEVLWMLNDEAGTLVMTDGMIAMMRGMGAKSGMRLTPEEVQAVRENGPLVKSTEP